MRSGFARRTALMAAWRTATLAWEKNVTTERAREAASWRTFVVLGAAIGPLFAVVWLGLTLTTSGASIAFALVKIIFTIVGVVTGLAALRWATASGTAFLLEALSVALWMILKVEEYPFLVALRTALMLAVPLGLSGVLLILADGMRAGTWPPARLRESARK
jgi:hypothetical protein